MADLVTLAEVKEFIGITEETRHDAVLKDLIDMVEELLEAETGQTFTTTTAITDEPHDGSGNDVLYLDRRPTALTADVKIGQDPNDPDTTIAQADVTVDQPNNRIIYEGGLSFPSGRRNIFVSYTATENVPALAAAAVKEATAFLYRRRGREHISGASINEFGSLDMFAALLDRLPIWQKALRHYRPVFA